jgi:release factor glutamine methyltransferase
MIIIEAYRWACSELENTISTSPQLDAEVLLCSAAGFTKENFVAQRNSELSPQKLGKFQDMVKSRKKGMPVAYLTGEKEFYNLKFKVNKNVLIPRPETETLVERLCFEMKGRHNLRFLDIGTGSGCIIISLAKNLSNANHYYGSDESARALGVAEENAANHKVKVNFIRSDLTRTTGLDYDIVIANLPYLSALEDPSTEFEPAQALLAKKGGLDLYERLFKELSAAPRKPLLYLEFGHDHADEIKALAAEHLPEAIVEIFKDLAGIPRFARIWQKQLAYL